MLSLPTELLLHIISLLPSDFDRQCLRVTCKRLYPLIPPPTTHMKLCDPTSRLWGSFHEHIRFLKYLVRDGNLKGSVACTSCTMIVRYSYEQGGDADVHVGYGEQWPLTKYECPRWRLLWTSEVPDGHPDEFFMWRFEEL